MAFSTVTYGDIEVPFWQSIVMDDRHELDCINRMSDAWRGLQKDGLAE